MIPLSFPFLVMHYQYLSLAVAIVERGFLPSPFNARAFNRLANLTGHVAQAESEELTRVKSPPLPPAT